MGFVTTSNFHPCLIFAVQIGVEPHKNWKRFVALTPCCLHDVSKGRAFSQNWSCHLALILHTMIFHKNLSVHIHYWAQVSTSTINVTSNMFCGLCYKHITIVNDASRVVREWRHNLERHSRVVNYNPRGLICTHLWRICIWRL